MAEITTYAQGTPCWVDLGTTDVGAAQGFYGELFGWTYRDTGEEGGHYRMALLRNRPVAGMWSLMPEMTAAGIPASWTTYFAADDADDVAERVGERGGTVVDAPVDVLDQGRLFTARDVTGAVFGVWQGRAMHGSGLANEPGAFTWSELLSRDAKAAGEFYAGAFGFDREEMDIGQAEPYTLFKLGGREVAGMMAMPGTVPEAVPSYWMTYFAVADADATVQRARGLGASVISEPRDTAYGRWAILQDPQGAVLSVMRLPEP